MKTVGFPGMVAQSGQFRGTFGLWFCDWEREFGSEQNTPVSTLYDFTTEAQFIGAVIAWMSTISCSFAHVWPDTVRMASALQRAAPRAESGKQPRQRLAFESARGSCGYPYGIMDVMGLGLVAIRAIDAPAIYRELFQCPDQLLGPPSPCAQMEMSLA